MVVSVFINHRVVRNKFTRTIYIYGEPLLLKWLQLRYPQQYRKYQPQHPKQIIELAQIHYYLSDPQAPTEFDKFLNLERNFIEDEIIKLAQYIEQKNNGNLSVRVNLKSGSYDIELIVLGAISIYANLALWSDFNDSINLIREQTQQVIERVSNAYLRVTGNTLRVQGGVTREPFSTVRRNETNEVSQPNETVNASFPPVSVTNSGSSPSNTNTVYVHVNSRTNLFKLYTWLGTVYLSTSLIIAVIYLLLANSYIHCQILNNSNLCYWISQELAFRLSGMLGILSEFFFHLSQSIMP